MKRRMKRHAVVQPLDPSYKIIALTQGQNALVDTTDYERLMQWNWSARWDKTMRSFYAYRGHWNGAGVDCVFMHQAIIGCKGIDHRNHNTLDNRRKNLLKATQSENSCNRRKRSDNTSGFKGVGFRKDCGKWVAAITVNRKRKFLGYFTDKKEAAKVYDNAAMELHGEFANLNFP
jgi:AP2 domain